MFPKLGYAREPAVLHVLAEILLKVAISAVAVKIKIFREGQRQHFYLYITPGEQCGQLGREQPGV
jgi:hypothetical protein